MARKTNSQIFSSSNYIYNYYDYSICSKDSLIDLKTYHLGKLSAVLLIIKIDKKKNVPIPGLCKCLYFGVRSYVGFKKLRYTYVYKHFVFEWVSSYKFPLTYFHCDVPFL